jgi:ribosomal protein S6--L-glutamate ligase
MKIGILVFTRKIKPESETTYESQRFLKVARDRGHQAEILFEPLFTFDFDSGQCKIEYAGKPFDNFDVILMRGGINEEPSLHTVTAETLKNAGYTVVNAGPTFSVSRNKLAQTMLLNQKQIPHPRSTIVRHPNNAAAAAGQLGYPVIIKTAFGTHGKGVFIAKDPETLQPIVDYLNIRDRNPVILQEFISEADKTDLRVYVVGDQVVAAMKRKATGSDFRSNAHQGAECDMVELTDEEHQIALDAARAFDLDIAGVDLIRSDQGPLVLEVNSSPGFEALEKTTSVDVAGEIVNYLETKSIKDEG